MGRRDGDERDGARNVAAAAGLELAVLKRTGEPVAYPTCKAPMHATTIHGVGLERCAKHGIWFDAGELQRALERAADPKLRPPLVPLAPARKARAKATPVELGFVVTTPGQLVQQLRLAEEIIRIGRAPSARALADAGANRMHAIIDTLAADAVWLIDLGSSGGTYVDGTRINKKRLQNGDRIAPRSRSRSRPSDEGSGVFRKASSGESL